MKFLFFVEGDTEKHILEPFIQRWLSPRLDRRVGIKVVNLKGNRHFHREIKKKVHYHFDQDRASNTVAAIGLLDLYKGADFPPDKTSVADRYEWGVKHYEKLVDHEKFRMFFAVHETEAWLLSDSSIFPREVHRKISSLSGHPETVDFDKPPAERLKAIYLPALRKGYKKIVDGSNLFGKLDPATAYDKCPYLKLMLDKLLALAQGIAL